MILVDAQIQHNLGLKFHRHNQCAEAELAYRKALALDPDFMEAWINLGLVVLAQKRPDEAILCERAALRLDPDSADAHNALGMGHCASGNIAEAEACFRAVLRLRPDHPNATLNLGAVRQTLNHAEEAELLFRRALELGADWAGANSNLGLALMAQGRPDAAERRLRKALAAQPQNAEARANLALALLALGRLEEGWREYESRWDVGAMAMPAVVRSRPRWTGHRLNGETVLLHAEQGFGDTLQFCRYASMVAACGGRVVLMVPKALQRVMRTLAGVSDLRTEEEALPPFDCHCPLLSLPLAFGTRLETIPAAVPYLRGDPRPWADILLGLSGLKVGLVWAGKARSDPPYAAAVDRRRSMRLAEMAPLLGVGGCSFVSLQVGPPASQMRALPAGAVLHDMSARLTDWADTAGLIMGLDLVIAVDTAVAHLAGALGKPVWLLNRFDSCWRWLRDRDDTPWYPTMRLFRQTGPGDWGGVIARVAQALRERVRG